LIHFIFYRRDVPMVHERLGAQDDALPQPLLTISRDLDSHVLRYRTCA